MSRALTDQWPMIFLIQSIECCLSLSCVLIKSVCGYHQQCSAGWFYRIENNCKTFKQFKDLTVYLQCNESIFCNEHGASVTAGKHFHAAHAAHADSFPFPRKGRCRIASMKLYIRKQEGNRLLITKGLSNGINVDIRKNLYCAESNPDSCIYSRTHHLYLVELPSDDVDNVSVDTAD